MKELQAEYKKQIADYCNRLDAIKNALDKLYPSKHIYVHLDNYEDFSHVFIDNEVLFSDGNIYKATK